MDVTPTSIETSPSLSFAAADTNNAPPSSATLAEVASQSQTSSPSASTSASTALATDTVSNRRPPAEDDCCVCFNGDSEEDDPILFCDGPGCDCVVHQHCYGIQSIPDGDWLCDMCAIKAEPSKAWSPALLRFNQCLLCPLTTGAFKSTVNGQWVHATCAIWIPETGFRDADTLDAVIGIEAIDKNRWKLECELCTNRTGCCVQCMGPYCRYSFHPMCGWKAGLRMELVAVGHRQTFDVVKLMYCDRHRNEKYVHNPKTAHRYKQVRLPVTATVTNSVIEPVSPSQYKCQQCGARSRQHECVALIRGRSASSSPSIELIDDNDDDYQSDDDLQNLYDRWVATDTERDQQQRTLRWMTELAILDEAKAELRIERMKQHEWIDDEIERELFDVLLDSESEEEQKKRWKPPTASTGTARKKQRVSGSDSGTAKRKIGRPPGSRTKRRACVQHLAERVKCPENCPNRPPPLSDAEIAAVAAKEETQRKAREEKRSAQSQQRLIQKLKAHSTEGRLQAQELKRQQSILANAAIFPSSIIAAASHNHFGNGAYHHMPHTVNASVSNPNEVKTRPDRVLSVNDPYTVITTFQSLLASPIPKLRQDSLKSLIVDCHDSVLLSMIANIFATHPLWLLTLCEWANEGYDNKMFPYVTVMVQALTRLVTKEWTNNQSLIKALLAIVRRGRDTVSPAVLDAVSKLERRVAEIGGVAPSPSQQTHFLPYPALPSPLLTGLSSPISGSRVANAFAVPSLPLLQPTSQPQSTQPSLQSPLPAGHVRRKVKTKPPAPATPLAAFTNYNLPQSSPHSQGSSIQSPSAALNGRLHGQQFPFGGVQFSTGTNKNGSGSSVDFPPFTQPPPSAASLSNQRFYPSPYPIQHASNNHQQQSFNSGHGNPGINPLVMANFIQSLGMSAANNAAANPLAHLEALKAMIGARGQSAPNQALSEDVNGNVARLESLMSNARSQMMGERRRNGSDGYHHGTAG